MRQLIPAAFVLVCAALAHAQPPKGAESNWHHWRGPNADGSAPAAQPPLSWDAKTNIA